MLVFGKLFLVTVALYSEEVCRRRRRRVKLGLCASLLAPSRIDGWDGLGYD